MKILIATKSRWLVDTIIFKDYPKAVAGQRTSVGMQSIRKFLRDTIY